MKNISLIVIINCLILIGCESTEQIKLSPPTTISDKIKTKIEIPLNIKEKDLIDSKKQDKKQDENIISQKFLINTENYKIIKVQKNIDRISIPGYQGMLTLAPSKIYEVKIPYNAQNIQVSFLEKGVQKSLGKLNAGEYKPVVNCIGCGGNLDPGPFPIEKHHNNHPKSGMSYSIRELHRSQLIYIKFSPVSYDPQTKETKIITEGEILLKYTSLKKGIIINTMTAKDRYHTDEKIQVRSIIKNVSNIPVKFTLVSKITDLFGTQKLLYTEDFIIPAHSKRDAYSDIGILKKEDHYTVETSILEGALILGNFSNHLLISNDE